MTYRRTSSCATWHRPYATSRECLHVSHLFARMRAPTAAAAAVWISNKKCAKCKKLWCQKIDGVETRFFLYDSEVSMLREEKQACFEWFRRIQLSSQKFEFAILWFTWGLLPNRKCSRLICSKIPSTKCCCSTFCSCVLWWRSSNGLIDTTRTRSRCDRRRRRWPNDDTACTQAIFLLLRFRRKLTTFSRATNQSPKKMQAETTYADCCPEIFELANKKTTYN